MQETDIQEVKEGGFVILKSPVWINDVVMTVIGITYSKEGKITYCKCAWPDVVHTNGGEFDRQILKVETFPIAALNIYKERKPTMPKI